MQFYVKILAVLGVLLLAACPGNEPKECSDLTAGGQAKCTAPNAIQGKTCLWMANACIEKSQALSDFQTKNLEFVSRVSQINNTLDTYGEGHGEGMNWEVICGEPAPKPNALKSMISIVENLEFNFKQDSDKVDVVVNCAGNKKNVYPLAYKASPLSDGNLLINFDLNGASVIADLNSNYETNNKEQLWFFTKTNWFFIKADNKIYGSSLLHDVGYFKNAHIDIKTEKDIKDVLAYVKSKDPYYASPEIDGKYVGAVTLIFNKK